MICDENRAGCRLQWVFALAAAAAVGQNTIAADPTVVPSTLSPTPSVPITLKLNLPPGQDGAEPGWDTANVAQCFVRSGGEQKSLLPLAAGADGRLAQFSVDRAGPALLCVCVGPPEARGHPDSWQRVTHCTKIILDVQPQGADGRVVSPPNPGVTAKTGQKIEILPLVDPTRLRKGDDLPLRVYYEGIKIEGARITASVTRAGTDLGRDGPVVEVTAARPTDGHGITSLPIARAGRWVVRLVHEVREGPNTGNHPRRYVAELIFEVPEGAER